MNATIEIGPEQGKFLPVIGPERGVWRGGMAVAPVGPERGLWRGGSPVVALEPERGYRGGSAGS
jgi:hypothetical protein